MKKIIAVVLLLAMLIPMGLISSVSGAEAEVKPFYFVNSKGELGTGAYTFDKPYVYSRVTFSASKYKGEGALPIYIHLNDGYGASLTVKGIPKMAQTLKEIFEDRPEGTRYIMFYKTIDNIVQPESMVYMDKGTQLFVEWAEEFFKEYKAIGGELDGVLLDVEYHDSSAYYLYKAYKTGATIIDEDGRENEVAANPKIYREIVDNPLYATQIRPLLEERGFTFTEDNGDKSEIFNIYDFDSKDAAIWDAVMQNREVDYMEKAIAPALKYFPDIMVTNYGFTSKYAWDESVNAEGGNTDRVGTTENQMYYVRRPTIGNFDTSEGFYSPTTYNGVFYRDTVYNSFLAEINTFKGMLEASDNKRISAFVSGFNYLHRNAPTNSTRLSPYYSETILHLGMLNAEAFLGYIVGPRDTDIEGEPYDYDDVIEVVSQLMSELTRVAGYADRKAIEIPKTWNSGFTLSGMYAGGRNIWRLTPDTFNGTTLENFKVEGKDPTFRIDGQTITFPGGKIIEDSKISHIGTCGYWVETAADVMPIVTSDADRYEKFPAFGENFDGYEAGMEYSYYNVEFPTSWKFKTGKGAKAVVEADKNNAANKVLALTGDVQLQNVRILENITAGDTYAEGQTWEVAATIPANMGAEGKITLLSINDDKGKVVDGGFQIAGGKLSYYNADKYVAFEGVDVSAGGKFTFKRVMDFNNPEAFTCDYVVYDAAGKELASVKDVPVAAKVKLPVQAIGLDFSKASGTVYVDDYKLYASGTATDFMLYDAKRGTQVAELDKARAAATAYRLSWMNATSSEKVYSVVAEYSNGDTKVIQEIKMAPNTDAVETGIVEVKDGQSVRVYLRNDSKTEPDDNTGDNTGNDKPGNTTKPAGDTTVILIVVIAVVAILASAVVFAIVIVSMKKKASSAAEEAKDESAE